MVDLIDLPRIENKKGWPWTEESQQMPHRMLNGDPWPRVTVVTPSYNQADFLEETIRSVLLQGYPDLEYIIMDGGSTDGSVEIIKKYEPWLAFWVSERDIGQSNAINKGWQRSTGEILAWLNSDDLYTTGAVGKAVDTLQANPIASMVYSDCYMIDNTGKYLRDLVSQPFDLAALLSKYDYIPQPTVFMLKYVLEEVGWLNENLHTIMDLDLWLRIGLVKPKPAVYLPGTYLAKYRIHPTAKSTTLYECFQVEALYVWDQIYHNKSIPEEVSAVRALAYSLVYFKNALAKVQGRQALAAIHYLLKSFFTYPKYTASRPLDTLNLLKEVALIPWRNFHKQDLR